MRRATECELPLHASLYALRLHPVAVQPGTLVLLVENPRLVEAAVERALPSCVVAGNGNPSAAVIELLTQLRKSGALILYHGDFDAAGIAICRRPFAQARRLPDSSRIKMFGVRDLPNRQVKIAAGLIARWRQSGGEWVAGPAPASPCIAREVQSMYAHPIKFLELLNGQVQYVVPRWQRRYCWGQSDIERLVEDLLAIAAADSSATHYGGTLLTFPDPGAAGVVTTIRVVDGQQRLTTVSILLASIAAELGSVGDCDGWTRQIILDDRLTNPGKPPEKRRKLRLQDGDEDEYRLGLEGVPVGAGAVTQAWRIARRLVTRNDVGLLLKGLGRLRVVSIGLDDKEDPQQIFESLNATGRPLTESEKVKNWLLMGLRDVEQQDLHDNHWLRDRATFARQACGRTH